MEYNLENKFATYYIAYNLRNMGFNVPCFAFYKTNNGSNSPIMVDDVDEYRVSGFRTCRNSEIPENYIAAPLWQDITQWLIENHKINAWVEYNEMANEYIPKYTYTNINITPIVLHATTSAHVAYEQIMEHLFKFL